MSDQQPPVPAPSPPAYAPPPANAPAPSQPEPKRKTALVIGIVAAVLLLGCCVVVGVGATLFLRSSAMKVDSSVEMTQTPADESVEESKEIDARTQEWLDWAPPMSAQQLPPMPAENAGLVAEALGIVAPGFSAEQGVWWQGGYDADEDWWYPDYYYVAAKHPSSDSVSAAVEVLVEGDDMTSKDIEYTPKKGDLTATIDGGARMIEWAPQWGPDGFDLSSQEDVALWKVIGDDWPEALVLDRHDPNLGEGYTQVSLTNWNLFTYDATVPYVAATYKLTDGTWALDTWEYVYPDENKEGEI